MGYSVTEHMALRQVSIRQLTVLAFALAMVLIMLLAAINLASLGVQKASDEVASATLSIIVSNDIENRTREYHRLGNLAAFTGREGLEEAMASMVDSVENLLQTLATPEVPMAENLLTEYASVLDNYFAESRRLQEADVAVASRVRSLQPLFEAVLFTSETIRVHNSRRLAAARAREEAARALVLYVSAGSLMVIVAGLVGFGRGAYRLVARPLVALECAMREARVAEVLRPEQFAVSEVQAIAVQFNERNAALLQQNRDQLTFLAAVAHDIRNPLQAIKLALQLSKMLGRELTADRLVQIENQIERANRMVTDLLDTMRVESGSMTLALEETDLRQIGEHVLNLYAATTTDHRLRLTTSGQPVQVWADSGRIEQILGNLLSNAIKYSPRGTEIILTIAKSVRGAEFSVSDQGEGMTQAEIKNLFRPFSRHPQSESVPGTGLGLFIVKRLVDAHHGEIHVASLPGSGTTFRVWIPGVRESE
jgi:signal transduction histidine kinase